MRGGVALCPRLNDNVAFAAHDAEALALVFHLVRNLARVDGAPLHAVLAKRNHSIARVDDRLGGGGG